MHELENELGRFFDCNPDGTVHQKAFVGQTFDRTVHKGDLTGIEIMNRRTEQAWVAGVDRLEEHRAIELVKSKDGAIAGVLMIDMREGDFVFVQARAVLLGTGGGPTMYRYHTPSGDKSCDGLAMALRSGLTLRDMEMVQFHPTGLLAGPGTRMTGTVLEEGLRGAGGYLLDGNRERFMTKYDPRGERATRTGLARNTRRDARRPLDAQWRRLSRDVAPRSDNVRASSGMVDCCRDCGFDLAGGLVEVVPTAHHMMGGVKFAADGRTPSRDCSPREDTGGVHGANRLGATASRTPPCSAPSRAMPWRRGAMRHSGSLSPAHSTCLRARAANESTAARRHRGDPRRAVQGVGTTSASCAMRGDRAGAHACSNWGNARRNWHFRRDLRYNLT